MSTATVIQAIVPEDMAGVAELADALKVKRTTISQWHSRQGTNGFPDPVAELAMGPVWSRSGVIEWWRGYTPLRHMPKVGEDPDLSQPV